MPALTDGILLGQGSLSYHVHPRVLRVILGAELTGQQAATAVIDPNLTPDER